MKKLLISCLVLITIFTLYACSEKAANSSDEPSTTPSDSVSTAPPETTSPDDTSNPADSTAPADPSGNQDSAITAETIGLFTDGIDPASRNTYNIVFEYPIPMAVMENMGEAMRQYTEKLNYNLTAQCSYSDLDKYIQDLEVSVAAGTDGFIIMPDPTISVRIKEVLDDNNTPFVAILNSMRDNQGAVLAPCVTLDNGAAGADMVQWLYDNYKAYWGDIDTSEIGLINFTFSAAVELNQRFDAAQAKFEELFPGNDNIFKGDGIVTGNFEAQTGFDLASAFFASNPDIKYWFVTSALEQYSQGAARAAESLGIEQNVLDICVGSDVLPNEWDNNYDGCWVACVGISKYQYTAPAVCGLITLLDGEATAETIWPDHKLPGDQYAIYNVSNQILTKDNYKQFYSDIENVIDSWLNS